MKKNLIKTVIAIFTLLVGISEVKAQRLTDTEIALSNKGSNIDKMLPASVENDQHHDPISPKALKHFSSSYKNIDGESWDKITDGYTATFKTEGIWTTIFYDEKGRWSGSLNIYTKEKMSVSIRDIIKSTYHNYAIVFMEEVETKASNHVPTYIVCIENDDTIKYIRMFDGEIEEWKECLKTK